jgi:tetratricopeptide (TPR) repeat protein
MTQEPPQNVIFRFDGQEEISVSLADGTVTGIEKAIETLTRDAARSAGREMNKLGEIFEQNGQYEAAAHVYAAAGAVMEKHDNGLNVALALSNQALALKRGGDMETPVTLYQKALGLVRQPLEDPAHEAARVGVLSAVLLNLGLLYYAKGQTGETERIIDWCLALVQDDSDARAQAIAGQCRVVLDEIRRSQTPGPRPASMKII